MIVWTVGIFVESVACISTDGHLPGYKSHYWWRPTHLSVSCIQATLNGRRLKFQLDQIALWGSDRDRMRVLHCSLPGPTCHKGKSTAKVRSYHARFGRCRQFHGVQLLQACSSKHSKVRDIFNQGAFSQIMNEAAFKVKSWMESYSHAVNTQICSVKTGCMYVYNPPLTLSVLILANKISISMMTPTYF